MVQTNFHHPAVRDLDLRTLVESDWAAYAFANAHRDFLNIPPEIPFSVRPRLEAIKEYWGPEGKAISHECIFKVSWNMDEPNPMRPPFPGKRQITLGTTLAIDWDTRQVRALLTADQSDAQRRDRDRMLLKLDQMGAVQLAHNAIGPDGKPLMSAVIAESTNQLMRVRGAARMLHISPAEPDAESVPPVRRPARRPRSPGQAAPDLPNIGPPPKPLAREDEPGAGDQSPFQGVPPSLEQSPFQGVPPALEQSPFQGVPPMDASPIIQGFIPPVDLPSDATEPDAPAEPGDDEKEV